jgi:hypothetical protein
MNKINLIITCFILFVSFFSLSILFRFIFFLLYYIINVLLLLYYYIFKQQKKLETLKFQIQIH